MRLSAKGRYATRIMVGMSARTQNGPIRKDDIARDEGLSSDYVEQILVTLKNGGLVRSHRGAHGGFSIARPTATITVSDILTAVEGPLVLAPCTGDPGECERAERCVTREVWENASALLNDYFGKVTLAELAGKAAEKNKQTSMFHI